CSAALTLNHDLKGREMRLALVGACLVLVGALGAACGGDDGGDSGGGDSATTADKGEFCQAWKDTSEAVMENSDDFDAIKGAYQDAFEVGTPEDMPDDAREGFEVMRDAIDEVDSQEELEEMEEP